MLFFTQEDHHDYSKAHWQGETLDKEERTFVQQLKFPKIFDTYEKVEVTVCFS